MPTAIPILQNKTGSHSKPVNMSIKKQNDMFTAFTAR